ncbi:MAG: cyclodeaminase/cyclohydrolase family protein [Euryarchaeota archaeon]|jgi:glutamate formiminotransferase/formiminotetrahydrofolate cyclodeaminase|nr:cyclodeaminase/cyclohydrolase family protein [Euryarchaeota archaeon]MBT5185028.1 cyclodeaminase/cyclohydrolase family protein [Euryarchaeota archaeon]
MKTPWMEMTLRDFQAALASSSPTPGGGTAAAIALGQASALAIMVCDLTLGKDKWKDGWDIADKTLSESVGIMMRAGALADEDSDAFDEVMASFKLPKETETEKESRRYAIRQATLGATEKPFETAQLALKLLELLPELAIKGNSNAASDVGVAGLLASAACKGALFNVDINLGSLPDDMAVEIRKGAPYILAQSRELSRKVMDAVRERI